MLGGPFPWIALGVAVAVGLLQAYRHVVLVPGYGWWIHHLLGGPVPPFLDMAVHVHVFEDQWFKNGDVLLAPCLRCGAESLLQTAHQIRSKGKDLAYDDIYLRVPWPDFVPYPDMTLQERVDFMRKSQDQFRPPNLFQTVSMPSRMHFHSTKKYIVQFRNPIEVARALCAYFSARTFDPAFIRLYGDFPIPAHNMSEFRHMLLAEAWGGSPLFDRFFVNHLLGYWPLRLKPNILVLRYEDRLADPSADVDKLAKFMGTSLLPEEKEAVIKQSSPEWLRAHAEIFEMRNFYKDLRTSGRVAKDFPGMLQRGAPLFENAPDLPADLVKEITEYCHRKIGIPVTRWLTNGGPMPTVELFGHH